MAPLRLRVDFGDPVLVTVGVIGDVDHTTADQLDALPELLLATAGRRAVRFDLRQASSIDSIGRARLRAVEIELLDGGIPTSIAA